MASPVVVRPVDARDLHRLGAAGELPEQLVAATERIRGARRRLGPQAILELDAIDQLVLEARALGDVELVAVAIARAQSLIALSRFVKRVEVHDQVELVVRLVRHPREGVGVVSARLVEYRQRFAVARAVCRDAGRDDERRGECPVGTSLHNALPPDCLGGLGETVSPIAPFYERHDRSDCREICAVNLNRRHGRTGVDELRSALEFAVVLSDPRPRPDRRGHCALPASDRPRRGRPGRAVPISTAGCCSA